VHVLPRDADEPVDTEGDQGEHDKQNNDDNGDNVVLLHGCGAWGLLSFNGFGAGAAGMSDGSFVKQE
jgi:hypothetical protein